MAHWDRNSDPVTRRRRRYRIAGECGCQTAVDCLIRTGVCRRGSEHGDRLCIACRALMCIGDGVGKRVGAG